MNDPACILEQQVRGEFPLSVARQQWAWRAEFAPTITFAVLLALVYAVTCILINLEAGSRVFLKVMAPILFLEVMHVGQLFCVILPFMLDNRFSSARVLRSNFHDYSLAGLNGRGLLRAAAAPQFAGIQLFAIVYGAAVVVTLFLASFSERPGWDEFCSFAMIVMSAEFNLVAGAYYHLTLWTRHPTKGQRLFELAVFIFLNPFTSLPIWGRMSYGYRIMFTPQIIPVAIGVVSLVIWSLILKHAWLAAIRRVISAPEEMMSGK